MAFAALGVGLRRLKERCYANEASRDCERIDDFDAAMADVPRRKARTAGHWRVTVESQAADELELSIRKSYVDDVDELKLAIVEALGDDAPPGWRGQRRGSSMLLQFLAPHATCYLTVTDAVPFEEVRAARRLLATPIGSK